MTKQEIYDSLVSLTGELGALNMGKKLFDAARTGEDGQKVEEVVETFKKENPDLYQKMCKFAQEIDSTTSESDGLGAEVLGSEDDEEKGIHAYDVNTISASSLFALVFLTGTDDVYLFHDIDPTCDEDDTEEESGWDKFLDDLEEESGSYELADFLANASFSKDELDCLEEYGYDYPNLYKLLADIFAGKLKEYTE